MKQLFTLLLLISTCAIFAQVPYQSGKDGVRIVPQALKSKGPANAPAKVSRSIQFAPPPDVAYQSPIVINKGGKYTGNYKSDDPNTPAIWVQTYDSVEISGCIIAGVGDPIRASGGSKLWIHHNKIYGRPPPSGDQWGRALNNYHPQTLTFEYNTIEHTRGILIDHADENTKSVIIRYNIIRNTDKRKGDLSLGDHAAAILFNTVPRVSGGIYWNQFENIPDSSCIEDNINLYNSGGTAASPYLIHNNYIKGAYPYPLNLDYYTGSGITIDGDPGTNNMDNMSQFVNAYNNQVISTCNAAMNIAAGHDIHFYANTMISSGMFPNGTPSERFWGGCCVWNASNVPVSNFINNTIKDNTIGYFRHNVSVPFPERQDWVVVSGSPISVQPGDNVSLPNPITLATELAEWPKWQAKLVANGITLGAGGTAVTPPQTGLLVTIKLGQKATGKIAPVNDKGAAVVFKATEVKATSGNTAIFTVALVGTDLIVTPVKAGDASGTVTLTTASGKQITKTFSVKVLAADPPVSNAGEAIDFSLTFTIS